MSILLPIGRRVPILAAMMAVLVPAWARSLSILRSSVELEGTVRQVAVADIDGDGLQDVLALHREAGRRMLSVLWGDAGGRFEASEAVEAPAQAVVADVGELDGKPGAEIAFLTAAGVEVLEREGRKLRPTARLLVQVPSIALAPSAEELLLADLAADFDGDGQDELLIQDFRSIRLLERRPDGSFGIAAELPVAVRTAVANRMREPDRLSAQALRITYTSPPRTSVDADGDGKLDLAFLWKDELAVYFQTARGFDPQARLLRDFAILDDQGAGDERILTGRLADVDGDRRVDVLFGVDRWGGTGKHDSLLSVYQATAAEVPPIAYPESPTQALDIGDAMGSTMNFDDFNADGRPDLVVLGFRTGLLQIVRMMLSRNLTFHSQLYYQKAAGGLEPDHAAGHKLGMKLRFGGGTVTPIIEFADFDGDGRSDLCYGSDDDRLTWFLGSRKGVGQKAAASVKVSPFGASIHAPVGGGPGLDLIVYYPLSHELGSRVELLLDAPRAVKEAGGSGGSP